MTGRPAARPAGVPPLRPLTPAQKARLHTAIDRITTGLRRAMADLTPAVTEATHAFKQLTDTARRQPPPEVPA